MNLQQKQNLRELLRSSKKENPMYRPHLSFPTLRFKKTSGEIKTSILVRVKTLQERQEALRKEVSEICSRWDLPADEVYAAGNDEEAIATYSTKMSNSLEAPGRQMTKGIVLKLQEDTRKLRELGREHATRIETLQELERVRANIGDDSRVFDLTFEELANLGF